MAREYKQGNDAKSTVITMRVTKADAEKLKRAAELVGKSEGEIARAALAQVLANIGSTAAIPTDEGVILIQPDLFGGHKLVRQTTEAGAGQPA